MQVCLISFFFFSSRRRHTRWNCDWSSDVCSSDLPGGRPLGLFESGAILVYLAHKTGQLIPRGEGARWETLQWLMFQMGGIGPFFGQVGFFNKFAGKDWEDKRPLQRYVDEAR